MDIPSANQSVAPQQWAGHSGWSSVSSPLSHQNPISSFQHLTLTSPHHPGSFLSDQSWPDCGTQPCSSDTSPPPSQPLVCNRSQQTLPQLLPTPQHLICSPALRPLTGQRLLNGPQSPLQKDSSSRPELVFASAQPSQTQGFSGYVHNYTSPSSPTEQQPQWRPTLGDHFVPDAVGQEHTLQSPNSKSRYGLDPESLPSAVKVMAEDQAQWGEKLYVSEPVSCLPPLATTTCTIQDKGSASPLAIRATTYCFPSDGQSALLSPFPLGALISPLAGVNHGQNSLADLAQSDCIGGCDSCGAFMCPAMGWQDCGQRFYCPFCGKLTDVPWQFYQPTKGVKGIRVDKDQRPELCLGSYEVISSQQGKDAVLLLAIDVSVQALGRGHLQFITQQIQTLLTSLNGTEGDSLAGVRVGLMTYDARIHLYDLSPTLSRPHMLVITETEELQLPVAEGLLVPLKDCIDSINGVLQLIPQFAPEQNNSTAVPVELPVKAALAVLQAVNSPGKLLIFHAAPLIEMEAVHASSGFFGSKKPKSIFEPSEAVASLVRDCVSQGCCVHLFHLSQELVGGAWPGHIPYFTGGTLHTYTHLQCEMDKECFSADLKQSFSMNRAFKAELKICVSKDIRVLGCYGLFLPGPSPASVAMASVDWWTTLALEVEHVRNLDEKEGVAIQSSLSYSTWTGERRTRVHTVLLRCSHRLQDAFRNYQAQTLLSFYTKKMYCAALERPLLELREELQTQITEALACYRKHCCSSTVSVGQLVLPQYLRELPVYLNSLRKSEVLLPDLRSTVHQRLQQRCQVLRMDPSSTAMHFYPQLLPLHLQDQRWEAVRCSSASLEAKGLYLVNTPLTSLLWVGSQAPIKALMELFNSGCFSSLPSGQTKLPVLETPLSIHVRSTINSMNTHFPSVRKLWVVKQGDSCEETLQRHLVEDKSPNGGASYADFLYHLHVNSLRLLQ